MNRDELVEFQVDGTHGSAVAGLRNCRVQHRSATPKPVWNPDLPATANFRDGWQEVPDNAEFDNGFKVQWERFVRHVADDEPFPYTLRSGARGVLLAELGLASAAEGRRMAVTSWRRRETGRIAARRTRPPFHGRGRQDRGDPMKTFSSRVVYAAAHVVADPLADNTPGRPADRSTGRRR